MELWRHKNQGSRAGVPTRPGTGHDDLMAGRSHALHRTLIGVQAPPAPKPVEPVHISPTDPSAGDVWLEQRRRVARGSSTSAAPERPAPSVEAAVAVARELVPGWDVETQLVGEALRGASPDTDMIVVTGPVEPTAAGRDEHPPPVAVVVRDHSHRIANCNSGEVAAKLTASEAWMTEVCSLEPSTEGGAAAELFLPRFYGSKDGLQVVEHFDGFELFEPRGDHDRWRQNFAWLRGAQPPEHARAANAPDNAASMAAAGAAIGALHASGSAARWREREPRDVVALAAGAAMRACALFEVELPRGLLDRCVALLPDAPYWTRAVPTHKDLTPRNMLWAPGASAARPRVRIVAWDDVAPGCRAEDLSRFLLGSGVLHYQGYQAQSARVAGRADALAPPLVAFAEAYLAATGGEGDAPGLEQFAWELQRLVPFGLLYSPQWNHPRARPSPALDLAARACERLRAALEADERLDAASAPDAASDGLSPAQRLARAGVIGALLGGDGGGEEYDDARPAAVETDAPSGPMNTFFMNLSIRDRSGADLELEVEPRGEVVAETRSKYCAAGGCAPDELSSLVLTLDGRQLSPDDATLWSLGVYPDAVLHAVCAPGAGLDAFELREYRARGGPLACCFPDRTLRALEERARYQHDEAADAAMGLGLAENDAAFHHALNQGFAASLGSRPGEQFDAQPRSPAPDEARIQEWLAHSPELSTALQTSLPTSISVRTCVSCASPMGLGLRAEVVVASCSHRGICETCAGALRAQERPVCPFCHGPARSFTVVNHHDENDRAGRSLEDRLARTAGEAGVSVAEWKKMSPSEQQAVKHEADAMQMKAARKHFSGDDDMDLDERQRFLIAQAGLQAELKEGRIDTTLLAESAGDDDPLRAMLLLDVLPSALW